MDIKKIEMGSIQMFKCCDMERIHNPDLGLDQHFVSDLNFFSVASKAAEFKINHNFQRMQEERITLISMFSCSDLVLVTKIGAFRYMEMGKLRLQGSRDLIHIYLELVLVL